jgi:hypothetical protein
VVKYKNDFFFTATSVHTRGIHRTESSRDNGIERGNWKSGTGPKLKDLHKTHQRSGGVQGSKESAWICFFVLLTRHVDLNRVTVVHEVVTVLWGLFHM